jgi:hypothetical protein
MGMLGISNEERDMIFRSVSSLRVSLCALLTACGRRGGRNRRVSRLEDPTAHLVDAPPVLFSGDRLLYDDDSVRISSRGLWCRAH